MMMRSFSLSASTLTSLLLVLVLVACESEAKEKPSEKRTEPPAVKLAGVWPTQFQCSSIATPEVLAQIIGAAPKQVGNSVSATRGIASPCSYEAIVNGVLESWNFDFDCRDNYKSTADSLFIDYKTRNQDMIAEWNYKSDAGLFKPNDAGVEYHKPAEFSEVPVGAKGLDHHGTALIFIDDDAPCYVRVTGKDAAKRLELAKLVAKNLTFQNAPMTPRHPR